MNHYGHRVRGDMHDSGGNQFGPNPTIHHTTVQENAPKPADAATEATGTVSVDAVVITAIATEYRAVTDQLDGPLEERETKGTLYQVGSLIGVDPPLRVAVAQVGMGNASAGAHLERARTAFSPRAILFVGVAGGIKDLGLGDVVAASSIYDLESGKETPEGYRPRAHTKAPSYSAVQRAMNVAARPEWTSRSMVASPNGPPRAVVAPIAAGGKVVADSGGVTAQRLRHYCGDAEAVEMEGYGFLHGAYMEEGTHALVVRGISDLLDDKTGGSDERWQPIAAAHAAAFAAEFLARFLGTR